MQNNPALAQKIQQNPKLILDLIEGKDISKIPASKNPRTLSPINSALINNSKNQSQNLSSAQNNLQSNPQVNLENNSQLNQNNFFKTTSKKQTQKAVTQDSATYIPSSDYVAKNENLSEEKKSQYGELLSKSDKILKQAEKYI